MVKGRWISTKANHKHHHNNTTNRILNNPLIGAIVVIIGCILVQNEIHKFRLRGKDLCPWLQLVVCRAHGQQIREEQDQTRTWLTCAS